MMAENKNMYKDVVKALFLSLKRLSLYAVDHPLSKEILQSLFSIFEAFLKEKGELLVVTGINTNEIVINNISVPSDALGLDEIYQRLKSFSLDGISFVSGLTYAELVDFVQALAQAAILDGGKPAPVPELLKIGSEHIKIKKVHYEKIEDGEKVVSEDVSGGGPGREKRDGFQDLFKAKKEDFFTQIKDFLCGKSETIEKDAAEAFDDLDKHASQIAEVILESAKETGDLEAVLKKFVKWVSVHVTPALIERKRDPSKFIQKFFDNFRKEKSDLVPSNMNEVIEECTDEITVTMLYDSCFSDKLSSRKKMALSAKLLSDEGDQKRILPKLKKCFAQRGTSEDEADAFLKSVEKELAKDEDVNVSKKKLNRLIRIAERFEEEVEKSVRIATEDLRRVNKKLISEKERSEGVMRYLADGLVVVDKDGKIVMANPAAEKLLGKEKKAVVGKSLAEGLQDEHLLAMAHDKQQAEEDGRITTEIELNGKDEETKKILKASSAVVENEDGQTVGMVSVLSDITRQKEVDEMKSGFVSLVTHELRTPVVAIQKSLELILSKTTGEINEDQERFLSISKFNLERLNHLINDLLDVSKLEAGKMHIETRALDLRDVVRDVESSLMSWIQDKEIKLILDLEDQPVNVDADYDRITQVLVNLVSNALKFTPKQGSVTVKCQALSSKKGVCQEPCVELSVKDTGIGIEPKDLKRIFNKFEQVSLIAPAGAGGTGLGLPIAKEIVNLHGGKIWAESTKDNGSRFFVVLPQKSAVKKE